MSTCPECYDDIGCTCVENKKIKELERELAEAKKEIRIQAEDVRLSHSQRKRIADAIEYEKWDTMAYPTLADAVIEQSAWYKATNELYDESKAENKRLRELLDNADTVMETAVIGGVQSCLAPAYQESWAIVHTEIKQALAKGGE